MCHRHANGEKPQECGTFWKIVPRNSTPFRKFQFLPFKGIQRKCLTLPVSRIDFQLVYPRAGHKTLLLFHSIIIYPVSAFADILTHDSPISTKLARQAAIGTASKDDTRLIPHSATTYYYYYKKVLS